MERKNKITVRMSDEEKDFIQKEASKEHLTIAAYLRKRAGLSDYNFKNTRLDYLS